MTLASFVAVVRGDSRPAARNTRIVVLSSFSVVGPSAVAGNAGRQVTAHPPSQADVGLRRWLLAPGGARSRGNRGMEGGWQVHASSSPPSPLEWMKNLGLGVDVVHPVRGIPPAGAVAERNVALAPERGASQLQRVADSAVGLRRREREELALAHRDWPPLGMEGPRGDRLIGEGAQVSSQAGQQAPRDAHRGDCGVSARAGERRQTDGGCFLIRLGRAVAVAEAGAAPRRVRWQA